MKSNNVRKIKKLLHVNSKPTVIVRDSDWNVVQHDNKLFILSDQELGRDEQGQIQVSELADTEAVIELLEDDKICVYEFQQLYQFNNSDGLLYFISLLNRALEINGYDNLIPEHFFTNPEAYKQEKVKNPSFSLATLHECHGATYSFELNGTRIEGEGTFVKYVFFKGIENSVETIEDLMSLYSALQRLIGEACFAGKDDMYLPCDEWLTDRFQPPGMTFSRRILRKEFQNQKAKVS